MFTGLIEETSSLKEISTKKEHTQLTVDLPHIFDDVEKGHSVAVNGVCLTVTNSKPLEEKKMTFDLGQETWELTNFKGVKVGQKANLERAMKLGERLHGHIVTGHVDTLGSIESIDHVDKGCVNLRVKLQKASPYIWKKGSIVVNGVSLTVNSVEEDSFEVCLIPETLEKTNLKELNSGDLVNIEYDFMAKSVIRAHELMKNQISNGE